VDRRRVAELLVTRHPLDDETPDTEASSPV